MGAGGVERQRLEPCPEATGAAKAADRRTELDADLLGDVVGVGGTARPSPCRRVDEIIMARDQLPEGLPVAALRSFYELRIQCAPTPKLSSKMLFRD